MSCRRQDDLFKYSLALLVTLTEESPLPPGRLDFPPAARRRSPGYAVGLAALLAALLAACAGPREQSYPSGYVYLDREQVVGRMAAMYLHLGRIEDLLGDDAVVSSEQQAEIVVLLNRIVAITDELGASNVQTSHRLIDMYIDAFRLDLELALRNASADPPNYFALGRVAGSCAACHQHL